MQPIRTAVIGTGFMGRVHLEALRRLEGVEPKTVCGRDPTATQKLASAFNVEQASTDFKGILADHTIDAVHICTPNASHFHMAKAALLAGKHVLCEKPIGVSVEEAVELAAIAGERSLRNCVCHNLRYYPMVQQMRRMLESGELGDILTVQGTYSQDWLLFDTDWNWRVEPSVGGPLRVMADIGSHWFDMAEHLTGLRVRSLCADLQTFHNTRKRPTHSVETFAGKLGSSIDVEEIPITTEDFGAVIFRLGDSARGAMTASQVSAGRKNQLRMEIYGTSASVAWDQERPEELWVGRRDAPNQFILKDPSLLREGARSFADLPGGHAEGYHDTFKQIFRRFYTSISDPHVTCDYSQFIDGLRQMKLMRAQLQSHEGHAWVDVPGGWTVKMVPGMFLLLFR